MGLDDDAAAPEEIGMLLVLPPSWGAGEPEGGCEEDGMADC